MRDDIHAGGCLCGQVRYLAKGEPLNVRLRHGRICQQATGQPFNARAQYRAEAVEVAGEVSWWSSSDAVATFTSADHIWVESALPWVKA